MSYEPRSRGMRSRRTTRKKPASKDKGRGEAYEFSYKEDIPINLREVSARTMNALEHLGNQRFGMPPYAEHLQRWIIDVESVLNDFQASLSPLTNQNFGNSSGELLSLIRTQLNSRISAEETLSAKITELRGKLADNEREITELESEQRVKMNEFKRKSDKSIEKLRSEIDALDAQRLKLLRQKPTLIERILGKAKERVEKSSRSIQSKRDDLESREDSLKHRMNSLRVGYETKRKPLAAKQAELRKELADLQANILDDALEFRKTASDQLREAVAGAVEQDAPQQNQSGTES